MTREEANKFLTEKMGKCWHKAGILVTSQGPTISGTILRYHVCTCEKCGENISVFVGQYMQINNIKENEDLFTPTGLFTVWNWAKKADLLDGFIDWWCDEQLMGWYDLIDPLVFPMKLAEWLQQEASHITEWLQGEYHVGKKKSNNHHENL